MFEMYLMHSSTRLAVYTVDNISNRPARYRTYVHFVSSTFFGFTELVVKS